MTLTHFRVRGWCDLCDGAGRLAFRHVDVVLVDGESAALAQRAALVVARAAETVAAAAKARLAELDAAGSHGCEAAGERRFEEGRLQVVEHDLWDAVGLTPVQVEAEPAGLVDVPLPGL